MHPTLDAPGSADAPGTPPRACRFVRRRLRATTLLLLVCATVARADDPPPDDAADSVRLERVEITGSRIRRTDGETALPVQIIRRDDIERSGAQSAEQLLSQITANVGSISEALTIGSSAAPGFSGASLRGLGSTRTLVLLDGRRLANYAFADQSGSGVDLHTIPLEAVERVEVLKDGASAIYGSDAIGGVINFILKKNYRGADVAIYRGDSQGGGGAETRATATVGFGDPAVDRFNLFAVFDYSKKSDLPARDRAYSKTAYRPDENLIDLSTSSFPANIGVGHGLLINPAAPACTAQTVFYRGGCAFDFSTLVDLLPPTEQASVLTRGTFAIDATHAVFVEALYDRSHVRSIVSPTPVAFLTTNGDPIVLPPSSPFYPTGLGLTGPITDIRYRTSALGQRIDQVLSEQSRVLVGTKGTFGDWEYDAALVYNESRATDRYVSGFLDASAIANALSSGLINPFGDSGPTGDALLASTQANGVALRGVGITRSADLHASRDLLALPAGSVSIALGVEGRRESLDYNPTAVGVASAGGAEGPPTAGYRSAEAAYAEFGIPIARNLDAQVAVRGDHYSDFGTTRNPKIALRWLPVRALLLRASYGRGFRAPSLPELFTSQSTFVTQVRDPVRCPVTNDDADCFAIANQLTGGNPTSLKPERSEQSSGGVVFEPVRNFSVSVDYWKIRLTNQISSLSSDYVLANDSLFEGTNIVRGAIDPAYPTLPGPIKTLILTNENLGAIRTHGLDVQLNLRSDPTPIGRFETSLTGTFTQEAEAQQGQQYFVNSRAQYSGGFVIPRWKHYLNFGWNDAAWTATIHEEFQTGYQETTTLFDGSTPTRHVGNYEVWGGQLAFTGISHVKLSLGVDNILNRAPPFTFQTDFFQLGYNPAIADPRGRYWYAKISGYYP